MKKKKENILIFVGFFIMIVLGVLLFLPQIEFQDDIYKSVISFVNSNPTKKTIEESIDELGQPKYMDETVALFEGGGTRRFGCINIRKEYDLIILYDEERCITEVYHVCNFKKMSGASSLLELIF